MANNIRGSMQNGRVASAVSGTSELRIPTQLPLKTTQDSSVVQFCDWLLATKESPENFAPQVKCRSGDDPSYSSERKLKAVVGLGRDFDV